MLIIRKQPACSTLTVNLVASEWWGCHCRKSESPIWDPACKTPFLHIPSNLHVQKLAQPIHKMNSDNINMCIICSHVTHLLEGFLQLRSAVYWAAEYNHFLLWVWICVHIGASGRQACIFRSASESGASTFLKINLYRMKAGINEWRMKHF